MQLCSVIRAVGASKGSRREKPGRTALRLRSGTDPLPRKWAWGSRRPRSGARQRLGRFSDLASGCPGRPWRKVPPDYRRTCRRTAHQQPAPG